MTSKQHNNKDLQLQDNRYPAVVELLNAVTTVVATEGPDNYHQQINQQGKQMMLSIFFDSHCPLCQMEMEQLKKHDDKQSIKLVDLHDEKFKQYYPHINIENAMNILHGELDTGEILYGLDVTCQAWQLVGKHKWLAILRWPIVSLFTDALYLFFAKHRNRISYLFTGKRSCNC